MDQFLFEPPMLAGYFLLNGVIDEGSVDGAVDLLRREYLTTYAVRFFFFLCVLGWVVLGCGNGIPTGHPDFVSGRRWGGPLGRALFPHALDGLILFHLL